MNIKKELEREEIKRSVIHEQIIYLRSQLDSQDEIVRVLKGKVSDMEKLKLKRIRERNERENEDREARRIRLKRASEKRLNYVGVAN